MKSLIPVIVLTLIGCSTFKARPAADSGFLPHPERLVENRERAPFRGVWIAEEMNHPNFLKLYPHILIRAVDISPAVRGLDKYKHLSSMAKMRRAEEMAEMALYMEERFRMALRDYPEHPFRLAPRPGPMTLEVVLALTEVNPTNPVASVAGVAAGALVPGGGLIAAAGSGSIAIEGLTRDAESQQLFLEFKDREADRTSPFSLKDFQRYAHIRSAIDDWADQFAELTATPPEHMVDDSSPFSLNPF